MNTNENLKTEVKTIGQMITPGVVRPTLHQNKILMETKLFKGIS